MSFYIASRFRNKEKVRELRDSLYQRNIECLCSWVDELPGCSPEEAAVRDLTEIRKVSGVIVLTEDCDLVPGGMHFEAGYAFGLEKTVVCVGPQVNIFYTLSEIFWYVTIAEFLTALDVKPYGWPFETKIRKEGFR